MVLNFGKIILRTCAMCLTNFINNNNFWSNCGINEIMKFWDNHGDCSTCYQSAEGVSTIPEFPADLLFSGWNPSNLLMMLISSR